MPKSANSVDDKLAALSELYHQSDDKKINQTISKALLDQNNRIVAKAAQFCEEKLLYESETELLSAYQRLLKNAEKKDAHCTGKNAILRALIALDYNDVEFYQAGLRYVQLEPVWGGATDMGIDIRCSSAMGLVSTSYVRAMLELVDLLNDKEVHARIGAVRAIAHGVPYEAALLLRQKITTGDDELEVIAECLIALLHVEPEYSLPLVGRYLSQQDDEPLYEAAALALGESRLDDALLRLQSAWKSTFAYQFTLRRILLRAVSLHRSDAAFGWLLSLVEAGDSVVIDEIIELLSIYQHNSKLKQNLFDLLVQYGTREHLRLYRKYWEH